MQEQIDPISADPVPQDDTIICRRPHFLPALLPSKAKTALIAHLDTERRGGREKDHELVVVFGSRNALSVILGCKS